MEKFSLGGAERERIEVRVSGYERQATGEYHDDNWLNVEISLAVGGFQASFESSFLTEELVAFQEQLSALYQTLRGEARFVSLENQLFLQLVGNGRGGISLKGEARDRAGVGNRLEFELALDQTQLATTIGELEGVIKRFPVRAG